MGSELLTSLRLSYRQERTKKYEIYISFGRIKKPFAFITSQLSRLPFPLRAGNNIDCILCLNNSLEGIIASHIEKSV